jgi:hypothetical protein
VRDDLGLALVAIITLLAFVNAEARNSPVRVGNYGFNYISTELVKPFPRPFSDVSTAIWLPFLWRHCTSQNSFGRGKGSLGFVIEVVVMRRTPVFGLLAGVIFYGAAAEGYPFVAWLLFRYFRSSSTTGGYSSPISAWPKMRFSVFFVLIALQAFAFRASHLPYQLSFPVLRRTEGIDCRRDCLCGDDGPRLRVPSTLHPRRRRTLLSRSCRNHVCAREIHRLPSLGPRPRPRLDRRR